MAIHGMDFAIGGVFRTNEGLVFHEKWARNSAFCGVFEASTDVRLTLSTIYKFRPYLSVATTGDMGDAVCVKKVRLCQLTRDNGGFSIDN